MGVTVLVVGSGGREHALAWRLAGEGVDVAVAPGNGGAPWAVPIQATDVDGLARFATEQAVSLTIVGPEAPLAAGLVNTFAERGLRAFGPTRAAARLEWSKGWAKEFLRRRGIPTGKAELVDSEAGARRAVGRCGLPVVIKADGLAGGKGVWVAHTRGEVELALDALFRRRTLGAAGEQVLIEEYLDGVEVTVMVFTDGERLAIMPPARDYKRLADGDRGPNTGGMGAYSPVPAAGPDVVAEIVDRAVEPTLAALRDRRVDYRGVLYCGVMLTTDGPKVLEYNIRFGDPEAQVVLPRFGGDFTAFLREAAAGDLRSEPAWDTRAAVTVVLAAPGYPAAPQTGDPVHGVAEAAALPGVTVFCAGVGRGPAAAPAAAPAAYPEATPAAGPNANLVTAGGRVLDVTALGDDVADARRRAYEAVSLIHWPGMQYRTDIATAAAHLEVRA
jgi:phosphoribosylamine--glycine ligase